MIVMRLLIKSQIDKLHAYALILSHSVSLSASLYPLRPNLAHCVHVMGRKQFPLEQEKISMPEIVTYREREAECQNVSNCK